MNEFTPSVNYSLHTAMPDTTSNIVSDVAGGVVASVVDAGASIWNSLPLTPEVETADLLRGISNNALRIYEENPDTIHTASFIGGMFVPVGLAMKGMGLMRAGVKGVNWFNKAGREADIAKVNELFSAGKAGTGEYRSAMRSFFGKSAVNQAIDAVAAEAALVTMMNKHPFLEDYMDDPVKNFAWGVAAGGVLGAGIGHVADRFAIKASTGALDTAATKTVTAQLTDIVPSMTGAMALQRHRINLNSLDNILTIGAQEGKTTDNDLTMSIAANFKAQTIVMENRTFKAILSDDMQKLGLEDQNSYLHTIASKPEMFGVNAIDFLPKELLTYNKFVTSKGSFIGQTPSLVAMNKKGVSSNVDSVFYPEIGPNGSYGTLDSVKHFAGAAAKYDTVAEVGKTIAKDSHLKPSLDNSLDLLAKSAADAQASYIGWLDKVSKMDEATFGKAIIGNTDNPALTAMLWKLRTDATLAGKKVRIEDKSLVYKAIQNQQVLTEGIAPETYIAKTQKVINETRLQRKDDINLFTDSGLSGEAIALMSSWKGGPGTWLMHLGATSHFARGYSAIGKRTYGVPDLVKNSEKLFAEIYNSASAGRLRAEFEKMADKDGFVYLYRGLKAKEVRGASPVESMTTSYDKALEFASGSNGRVDMYRIHPSDIVGAINDIKGGGGADATEILVRASARHAEATLDSAGKVTYRAQQLAQSSSIKPASNVHSLGEDELAAMIRMQKADEIDALMANGIPAASIAIKTNTPVQLVEAYMAGATKGEGALADVISAIKSSVPMDATTGNAIASLTQAEAALGMKFKPLKLSGDLKKNPYIEGHANLDNKQMADMNRLFVSNIMLSSKSQAVRELGNYFSENSVMMDMFNELLTNISKETAGTRFFNSFDSYVRNFKDLGPVVSAIDKKRGQIVNSMIERVAKPIQNAMGKVIADPVGIVEFNTFKTVNDGLKGWRHLDKDGYLVQKVLEKAADGTEVEILKPVKFQGADYQVKTKAVKDLVAEIRAQSTELLEMGNAARKIKGVKNINDIGLWLPAFNPVNKYVAYVWNATEDTTQMLWANTAEGLKDTVIGYQKHLVEHGIKDTSIVTNPAHGIKVIGKGIDQEAWSVMNGRMDPLTMTVADTSMLKTGAASSAVVPSGLGVFGEVVGGYEHYINAQMRNLMDASLSDSMYMLDRLSELAQTGYKSQPLDAIKKVTDAPKDPAKIIKNTLLGDSLLGEYAGWKWANSTFETGLRYGQRAYNEIFHGMVEPLTKGFFKNKTLSVDTMQKMDYEELAKKLDAAGVVNPWKTFGDAAAKQMGLRSLEESADTSKRIVYAGNALAATIALRVGELAQPLVNMLSLPILTYLAKAQEAPEIFLGIAKTGKAPNAAQLMYEGARAANSPTWAHFSKRWEDLGYFTPMISESNKTLHMSRSMDKGIIPSVEKALDSEFVKFASKPADWSESWVRRQTMFTGAVMAKRLWPGLDDAGVTIFARDFMDKAVGNFHASQRPTFFQGTLGVALGLFQTYSLTLGQSVYRHLELKNYKVLGKAALTQSGIFGTGSLPGFNAVSNQIGEHFSDDHVDLVTGSYRALPDPLAETILYGLPSQLGIGTHTRGDVNPRFPGLTGDSIVALNFAKQAMDMVGNVGRAMGEADTSVPRAIGEALSLQSLSRPLARGAELLTGYSKTSKGNTVQVPDEVWTFSGIGARLLSTRPIMETKLRDAMHLNSFYNSADSERRQAVIDMIQTKIRNGTLSNEDISKGAETYLGTGGTPTGWRSAISTAIATTETSGREIFLEKLKPNSPLFLMIDALD